MSKSQLQALVRDIVGDYCSLAFVDDDAHLIRDLGIDSLSLLGIVSEIEEAVGLTIPIDDLYTSGNFRSVSNIADYLVRRGGVSD